MYLCLVFFLFCSFKSWEINTKSFRIECIFVVCCSAYNTLNLALVVVSSMYTLCSLGLPFLFCVEPAPTGSTDGCVSCTTSSMLIGVSIGIFCVLCLTDSHTLGHSSFIHSFVSQTNSPWIQDKWLFIHFVKFVLCTFSIKYMVL